MFTGLVEAQGRVSSITDDAIVVSPLDLSWREGIVDGESVAVNGACLTVVEGSKPDALIFQVSPESFARTSLGDLVEGSEVNLERAMRLNERLGGHIVQGHVDATGSVVGREDGEQFSEFIFQAPEEYDRYLIDKGSVAIDGISLTVVKPEAGRFSVWLIPATLEHTNLKHRGPGDRVNFEFDMIAKYLEKLVQR